jgi:hypothetical protein
MSRLVAWTHHLLGNFPLHFPFRIVVIDGVRFVVRLLHG